ncbi:TonB-dependent receptor [Aquincola sp. MAHUQ-54]|uniref:TonB-dependent receptor n=1 Tax=Aquincola agrisoli TaxID=3119538 RepID=A0AAW9QJ67_9BURK
MNSPSNLGCRARWRSHALAATSICLASPAVLAQSPAPADTVVVTASRIAQPLSQVLADMSVLDRVDIERSGAASVADLLARLPGIEISRSGGPVGTTGVFIRGSETRHVAVFIDGQRIDSQSTGGALWEQVPLEQIDRIEVVRGPAAAVYGSDAVGGVVQFFTRRGEGKPLVSAGVSLGSRQAAKVHAAVSGAAGALDYALSASHDRSDGFNSRPIPTANPDDDGWRRSAMHARVGARVAEGHRVEATLTASNIRSQYDAFGTTTDDDTGRHMLRSGALSWQGRWSPASQTRVQLGESRSTYETRPSFYRTETTLRDLTVQHEQRFGVHTLTVTAERKEDQLHNPATEFVPTLDGDRSQDALALGWRADLGAHALQVHVRHDHDSEFGNKGTGSVAWGWTFAPGWRASASAATSFRAPTLYQRFSEYGVASLVPESGRNLELALRWSDAVTEVSATAWRNRVRNLIVFGAAGACQSTFGCYESVGRAEYEGLTLAAQHRAAGLALRGSLDWHDPRNTDTDKILARRARVLATFGVDGQWAGWGWGAEVQAAGKRYDDAANTRRLGGYGLVNLRAEHRLARGLSLEARIDNVADKDYELARDYATAGRVFQVGLRWTME